VSHSSTTGRMASVRRWHPPLVLVAMGLAALAFGLNDLFVPTAVQADSVAALEFESLGLSAAPMSVLADDERTRAILAREFEVPPGRRPINAFRLGVRPRRSQGPKPRLPRAALIV